MDEAQPISNFKNRVKEKLQEKAVIEEKRNAIREERDTTLEKQSKFMVQTVLPALNKVRDEIEVYRKETGIHLEIDTLEFVSTNKSAIPIPYYCLTFTQESHFLAKFQVKLGGRNEDSLLFNNTMSPNGLIEPKTLPVNQCDQGERIVDVVAELFFGLSWD